MSGGRNVNVKKSYVAIAIAVAAVLLVVGTVLADRARTGAGVNGNVPGAVEASATASGEGTGAVSGSTSASAAVTASGAGSTGNPSGKPGASSEATLVTKNVPLEKVTAPPTKTVALLDATKFTAGARYAVTFIPYGTGPEDASLVIQVSKSSVVKGVRHPFDFTGRNVLVRQAGEVKAGGTYTGVIELSRQGDAYALHLSDVEAKQ